MTKVVDSLSKISTYSNEFEIKQTNKTLLKMQEKKSRQSITEKTFAWLKKAQKKLFSQQRASVS